MNGIVLGYIGVHQIFQLALAAQEANRFERLYCSLVDLPGKWGAWFGHWIKAASLRPLGINDLEAEKITEIPLPLLGRQFSMKLSKSSGDYYQSNRWFDRLVSHRLASGNDHDAGIFIGAESCALESMRAAKQRGMTCVLDCPGIASEQLASETRAASEELGITCPIPGSSSREEDVKAAEMEVADLLLFCSETQQRYYISKGLPAAKMRISPLWLDPSMLNTAASAGRRADRHPDAPLRALYVGAATVAKGAPYAISAVEQLRGRVTLSFCGGISDPVAKWAGSRLSKFEVIPWIPRAALKQVYREHDILIFPTLGDSFGFVAMEAMGCGLPVITTTSAGAPLPKESWRVPPRSADAIAARLETYLAEPEQLTSDAYLATKFASNFTPEAYRQRARAIFAELASQAPKST